MYINNMFDNALITGGSGMIGTNINFGIKPTSNEMDVTSVICEVQRVVREPARTRTGSAQVLTTLIFKVY